MEKFIKNFGWIIWLIVFLILLCQTILSGKDMSVFAGVGLIIGYLRFIHRYNI
jgi:hypothetical protein